MADSRVSSRPQNVQELAWEPFGDRALAARTKHGTYFISHDPDGWHLDRPGESEAITRPDGGSVVDDLKRSAEAHYASKTARKRTPILSGIGRRLRRALR